MRFVFGLLALAFAAASGSEVVVMNGREAGAQCIGEDCLGQVWCWQGSRFADLNQLTRQITAVVSSKAEEELCVDYESDDQLSAVLRHRELDAAHRLLGKPHANLFTSTLRDLFAFSPSGLGAGKEVKFSGYLQSCVALCKAPKFKVEVDFASKSWLSVEALSLMVGGLVLVVFAPRLSGNRVMFYLSGGVLGVLFAVAGLVLAVGFRTARPSKTQVTLALMCQFSVVLLRDLLYRLWASINLDWVVLYVLVSFTCSLCVVHYYVSKAGGAPNPALVDLVQIGIQIVGVALLVAPIPSPTLKALFGAFIISSQLALHLYSTIGTKATAATVEPSQNAFQTPKRRNHTPSAIPLSVRVPSSHQKISLQEYNQLGKEYTEASVKALLASPQGKAWLSQNLDRFQQDS
ncbi:hypothetical protein BASA81_006545 [Batrachochytrium salamandrivorans]|nr:hypothetical protein BASA81_006545 [Batrachochytrium salamandrivorans]